MVYRPVFLSWYDKGYKVNINQTITKTEINAVEKNFKKAFSVNYYINVLLLFFCFGFAGYNAYYAVEDLKAGSFSSVLFALYFVFSCWFIYFFLYNCRIKATFKYISKLKLMMYDKDSYTVVADEENVTVDENILLNWKDFEIVFLCGEYVVLGSYKKLAVILKVTEEERNQICQLMAGNKKAIVALDGGNEAVKYNRKSINKFRKKLVLIAIVAIVTVALVLVKSVVPVIPVENSSASSAKQDFNPELAFNGQMANALDSEGVTGFNFDAEYMFDMYAEYIKYRFNTAVKEYDNTPADRELWFFDGENTEFGFDIDKSKVAGKSQISYFNDENKVRIEEKNGQPYAEKEAYKMESWDDVFSELMMKDYALSKYPKLETFGGSGSNYFYAKFRTNTGKSISYRFGENYILCEEYRGKRVTNSFLMVFTYKSEDKLDYTEALFNEVLTESEKPQSEQNIDFELLTEEIEKYCDYTVSK